MYDCAILMTLQLGNSAILGILDDAHLNTNQYNWLSVGISGMVPISCTTHLIFF